MWWWHTFGLLLIAGLLIAKGLRGIYIGDEPRCLKCTYELTGITSSNCPECGNGINLTSVIYGKRHIRWRWLLMTLLVPLFWQSSIDSIKFLPRFQWNHYALTTTIFDRAKQGDESATDEIQRRIETNPPASRHIRRIVDFAISKHKQWPLGTFTDKWTRILEVIDYHGLLLQNEGDQIFPKYVRPTLECRTRIRQGDYVALRLSYQSARGGMNGYAYWQIPRQIFLGKDIVYDAQDDSWQNHWPSWYRSDSTPVFDTCIAEKIPILEPGVYKLKYDGRHVMMHGLRYREFNQDHENIVPNWTKDISLDATVEIINRDDEDPVSWIERPELHEKLHRSINVQIADDMMWWSNRKSAQNARRPERTSDFIIISVVSHRNSDVPYAFKFFVRANGRMIYAKTSGHNTFRPRDRAATSLVSTTKQGRFRIFCLEVPRLDTNQVEIVLRSSKELARQTVDLYSVWHGSLTYGPFDLNYDEGAQK